MKLSAKLSISLAILGVLLTAIIGTVSYLTAKSQLEKQRFEMIRNVATSCASMISAEDVDAITAPGGDQGPEYKRIKAVMDAFKTDNGLTYLVLEVPAAKEMVALYEALAPGDDPADFFTYKEIAVYDEIAGGDTWTISQYEAKYDDFIQVLEQQEPMITDDEYGYIYCAYAIISNDQNKPKAMVEANISMEEVRASLNRMLFLILGASFLGILLLILIYLFFIRKSLISPITSIAKAASQLVEGDSLKTLDIAVNTGDELQSLGEALNYLSLELIQYVDNLKQVTTEKERIGAELNVAARIQSSMLPSIFPPFPERTEFDLYGTMLPAKEVGGDFYDFFLIDDSHLGVVVADVSGKGVPAALFMVIAKTLIKNHATLRLAPSEVFKRVNDKLCEGNEAGMFVTAFLGVLDLGSGELSYVNAGHNPPVIIRADGEVFWLKGKSGFVLAGMEGMQYAENGITLAKGDRMLLYTDGVTEATNANNELFSDDRLMDAVSLAQTGDLRELIAGLKQDIDGFVGAAPQFDDITMLALWFKDTGDPVRKEA